jgi:hypothetical protein
VLDFWFERVVKPRLQGEVYLMRYIDDCVVCFQYQTDAQRFEQALIKRLAKFALALEPTKTRLWRSAALPSVTPSGRENAWRRLRFWA